MATQKECEQAAIVGHFINEMLSVRDMLRPIISGEIERGHCLPGKHAAYLDKPGSRKTKLADAVSIAKHAEFRINRAVNEIHENLD